MLHIYKASAGSGKTYTLTLEYIKLLLGYRDEQGRYWLYRKSDAQHRRILAVTFTNKATEEMKHRIVFQLDIAIAVGGILTRYGEVALCRWLDATVRLYG